MLIFIRPCGIQSILSLLSCLLKIQTNSRILNQQEETANKSQAVQLDTKHISKVYECLVDPNNVELELSNGSQCERQGRRFHGKVQEFTTEYRGPAVKWTICHYKAPQKRVGLSLVCSKTLANTPAALDASKWTNLSVPFPSSSWSQGRHLSSWSRKSTGLASPALSSLSFCEQASPVSSRPTLGVGRRHLRHHDLTEENRVQRHPSRHSLVVYLVLAQKTQPPHRHNALRQISPSSCRWRSLFA